MENQSGVRFRLPGILSGVMVLFGLYLAGLYSYLLFHSLVEIFSIVVACAIFIVTWNVRRLLQNNYFLFIGIAYLFIGGIDLVHTLAYKGMGVFSGYGPNLPTQLWIIARYMESVSLLLAPWFVHRKIKPALMFGAYALATAAFMGVVFHGRLFPECFVEGVGLTSFKKISEYVISMVLLCAMAFLYQKRKDFDKAVFRLLATSIILTIGAELAFTFYVSVYGLSNLIGHFLKLISFYLIYKAIIETGLVRPYDLLFRDLKQSEEGLKKSRHELELKARALEEANRKLQEATRLKSRFLANMSHELRTPLNSIIGFTGIILQGIVGELNPEQKKQLAMVYDSGKHLLGLINDILDLSKIEAGKIEIIPALFNVKELVRTVEEMVAPLAEEKGLKLEVSLSEGAPLTLFQDKNRIKQVLINLLSNAIKFTETGRILLEVNVESEERSTPAQSPINNRQSTIQFSVTDTGIGIKPEHLADIFDEFKQIEGPLKEKPVGTGLGLAISRKMVEMMGGDIRAESAYGKGSCFRFAIPMGEMGTQKRTPEILQGALDDGKRLVLTIDDEYESQEILKNYLKSEGYEVIQAYNSMEAMELAGKHRPFAITLDIMMPGKDGWDILRDLKNDPLTETIPVICISILDNRELGLSLGAVEYLVKPIDKGRLMEELKRLEQRFGIYDILIVDDEPQAVEIVAKYLGEGKNYRVRKAYGGEEGLLRVRERRPDLIILDLIMPGVDGFEVIRRLKASEQTKAIPVIIVSGKEMTREEISYLNSNIEKIIRKRKFGREKLLEDIRKALAGIAH